MSSGDVDILSLDMAEKQAWIRKVFSNILTVLIGALYSVQAIFYILTYFSLIDISLRLEKISSYVNIFSLILVHLIIILLFALPVLLSVTFFMLFANSKNYSQELFPCNGAKVFRIASFVAVIQSFVLISLIMILLFQFARFGVLIWQIVLFATAVILLLIFYAVGLFLFADSIRMSIKANMIISEGSVFWGVINIIISVAFLICFFAVGDSIKNISGYLLISSLVYAFMAAFCFQYKIMADNAKAIKKSKQAS